MDSTQINRVIDLILKAEQNLLELRIALQEQCDHPRKDSCCDSDGPSTNCLDCGKVLD